jgi:hypothetical protein
MRGILLLVSRGLLNGLVGSSRLGCGERRKEDEHTVVLGANIASESTYLGLSTFMSLYWQNPGGRVCPVLSIRAPPPGQAHRAPGSQKLDQRPRNPLQDSNHSGRDTQGLTLKKRR